MSHSTTAADAPVSPSGSDYGEFRTSDGVTLRYLQKGSGRPLILLHGWSQSAALFKHQIDGLAARYRVIALDMRGHGASDKPPHGYNIHRMSKDLREFLKANALRDVFLLGHSMGVKVIWGYVELYGTDRISKLVLVDDSPSLLDNPGWSPDERAEVGPMFVGGGLGDVVRDLMGKDGERLTADLIAGMFTAGYRATHADDLQWVISENLKMPRRLAGQLLFAIATIDWRETIKRIDVPTLVMGGEKSTHRTSVIRWEADQIRNSKLRIWGAEEGGSHFVFLENPPAFNEAVAAFLDES